MRKSITYRSSALGVLSFLTTISSAFPGSLHLPEDPYDMVSGTSINCSYTFSTIEALRRCRNLVAFLTLRYTQAHSLYAVQYSANWHHAANIGSLDLQIAPMDAGTLAWVHRIAVYACKCWAWETVANREDIYFRRLREAWDTELSEGERYL